jgi:hypothetical protein
MDLFDIAIGVFLGNCLTLCLVWGFSRSNKPDSEVSGLAILAVLIPIGIALAHFFSIGYSPTWLGAVAAQ